MKSQWIYISFCIYNGFRIKTTAGAWNLSFSFYARDRILKLCIYLGSLFTFSSWKYFIFNQEKRVMEWNLWECIFWVLSQTLEKILNQKRKKKTTINDFSGHRFIYCFPYSTKAHFCSSYPTLITKSYTCKSVAGL